MTTMNSNSGGSGDGGDDGDGGDGGVLSAARRLRNIGGDAACKVSNDLVKLSNTLVYQEPSGVVNELIDTYVANKKYNNLKYGAISSITGATSVLCFKQSHIRPTSISIDTISFNTRGIGMFISACLSVSYMMYNVAQWHKTNTLYGHHITYAKYASRLINGTVYTKDPDIINNIQRLEES